MFSLLDTNDSGTISLDEVKAFMLMAAGNEDRAEGMMKEFDTNEDGTVTKEEFLAFYETMDADGDYAARTKDLAGDLAELKEKAEAKADDGGKKSRGRERGGVRSGCEEGGANRDQSGFIPFDAFLLRRQE